MKTILPIAIGGRQKVCPEEVILLEADINYTKLYLVDGQKIIVATTLKQLEKRFVILQNFFRTHKSHLINLNFVAQYQAENNQILMQNQKVVCLSRRRKNEFSIKITK